MYNILIIDDEHIYADSIAENINWYEIGFTEIFKAYDSSHAMQLISRHRIDIAISDILIPEYDGTKISEFINSRWPHAKIIFITGHEEFEYAKKAVALGIFAFLLKPVDYEEIKSTVLKAVKQLEEEIANKLKLEHAENILDKSLPLIRERLLTRIIVQGVYSPEKDNTSLAMCGLDFNGANLSYILMMISIDEFDSSGKNVFSKKPAMADNEMLFISIVEFAQQILFRKIIPVFFSDFDNNIVALISGNNEEHLNECLAYACEMLETFQEYIKIKLHSVVSVAWDRPVLGLYGLNSLYKRLKNRIHRIRILSSGNLLTSGADTGFSDVSSHPGFDTASFSQLIESYHKGKILTYLDSVFSNLQTVGNVSYERFMQIYYGIGSVLIGKGADITIFDNKDITTDYFDLFKNFNRITSISTLKNWCLEVLTKWFHIVEKNIDSQSHSFTEHAKEIINDRFHQNLTLSEIASELHLHPNYLCKLFHEKEGMTITDYITKCRMIKARELLSTSGIKIYEVAESVGYASVSHFNRVFKNFFGINPKSWQTIPPSSRLRDTKLEIR